MYVYIYILYIYIYVYRQKSIYAYIRKNTYLYMHIHLYICTYIYICTCICEYMIVYKQVYLFGLSQSLTEPMEPFPFPAHASDNYRKLPFWVRAMKAGGFHGLSLSPTEPNKLCRFSSFWFKSGEGNDFTKAVAFLCGI